MEDSTYCQRSKPPQQCLMAPSGCLVTSLVADTSSNFADASWKDFVTRVLATEGINISSDSQWLVIQAVRSPASTFIWPASLLMVHAGSADPNTPSNQEQFDWRSWFVGFEGVPTFCNPLATAEEWFKGSADRQRATKAQDVAGATFAMDESSLTATNLDDPVHSDTDMTAPFFAQRNPDQQTTMAGIYPTPPDGLTHGQQSLASIAVSTPSVTQVDPSYTMTEQAPTSESSQGKIQRFPTDLSEAGFQMGQDELFGDPGEMEFGENEVGDAILVSSTSQTMTLLEPWSLTLMCRQCQRNMTRCNLKLLISRLGNTVLRRKIFKNPRTVLRTQQVQPVLLSYRTHKPQAT